MAARRPARPSSRPARAAPAARTGEAAVEAERLQKVLARAGVGSRREIEEWIRAGRISINGTPAILGVRVRRADQIKLDGRLIRSREPGSAHVFLCHRSPGEALEDLPETNRDPAGASSLLERLPRRAGRRFVSISPMPRIDGGLELLTSDGDLAARLQRSMRRLSGEFSVRIHGELSPASLATLMQGELDSGQTIKIEQCTPAGGEGSNRWYSLVATGASGKDVRQLFERQGALVSRVLRVRLGPLALERHLPRGRFRELTREELDQLIAATLGHEAPRLA